MPRRIHKTIVIAALAAFPFLVWLAIAAKTSSDDLNNWIDKSSAEYVEYQKFSERFGNGDEVLVSWDGCTVDDPRLPLAASAIRKACQNELSRVVSGDEVLQSMKQSASKFSDRSARRRLRGSLFGEDLKTTCIVVTLNAKGRADLSETLTKIKAAVKQEGQVPQDQIRLGGKAISDHALTELTNRSLWWGIPGALLAAMIALLCIRDWKLTIGMVFVAGLAAVTSLAMVPICGIKVNGLLVLMPVLVFVLTLGCAVHMVRTLQRHIKTANQHDAWTTQTAQTIAESLCLSRPPVMLSLATTAIGIGCLAFSPLSAVFQFGCLSAAALLVGLAMLLFLLPAIWHWWGIASSHKIGDSIGADEIHSRGLVIRALDRINRRPLIVIALAAIFCTPAVLGISRFETDLNTHSLFAESTRFSQDHHWMEQNLYPLGRVDIVVSFPKSERKNRFLQLQQIRRIASACRNDPAYHSALSVANFVQVPKSNSPIQRQLTEQIIATQIDHDYPQLNEAGMLYSDESDDHWRITIACQIDEDNDERSIGDRLQVAADTVAERSPGEFRVVATGMGPLAASGQRRLFQDLVRGLLTALVVVTPLIMLWLRSVPLGLLAMIPNLLPIVVVFGYCGLLGRKLDIGAILTASVGLGIAIDDTVHFLHYYSIGRKRDDKADPVLFAIKHCTKPIITTTLIVLCGLILFSLSEFLPVRNFAICLILMMITAAFADLVLLPALLRLVRRRTPEQQSLET